MLDTQVRNDYIYRSKRKPLNSRVVRARLRRHLKTGNFITKRATNRFEKGIQSNLQLN